MSSLILEPDAGTDPRDLLSVVTRALETAGLQVVIGPYGDGKGVESERKAPKDTSGTEGEKGSSPQTTKVRLCLADVPEPGYVGTLEHEVRKKESELDDLEAHLTTALQSIKTFHVQQKELFDEFVALREKYDTQKERLNTAIWEFLPTVQEPLTAIPDISTDEGEVEDGIGNYRFGVNLGEGQFAHVRACSRQGGAECERKKKAPAGLRRVASDLGLSFKTSHTQGAECKNTDVAISDSTGTFSATGTTGDVVPPGAKGNGKHDGGCVPKARGTDHGVRHDLAVKIIQKDKIVEARDVCRINNEIKVLRSIAHPNIVKLVDVVHTPNFLYIFMGRGGEDLFEYVSKRRERGHGPIMLATLKSILGQLVSSITFLHRQGICHRDLKPENILLDIHGHLTIVDFGLCEHIGTGRPGSFVDAKSMPPERLLSDFCGRYVPYSRFGKICG